MTDRGCVVGGCEKPHSAKGFCGVHYLPYRERVKAEQGRLCGFDGCDRPQYAKGYCRPHYRQKHEAGKVELQPIRVQPKIVTNDVGEYQCWNCGLFKSLDSFSARNRSQCRRCRDTLYRYGLDAETFAGLLAEQGGGCAICGTTTPGGRWKVWHVDHDHKCCPSENRTCGECVQGLLCNNCNMGIGFFADDADRLQKAAAYVVRTRAR